MNNYLKKLQKKCDISDELMLVISDIFEKLVKFGYVSSIEEKKLQKKLYENINAVITGDITNLDYKSGYYDAMKKEL